jgi:hypothetical protein
VANEADEIRRHTRDQLDRALHGYAELVLGTAGKYVLEDEGTLAASGHLEPEHGVRRRPDGGAEIDVVYSTPYAARRHEEIDVTPSIAGRQPKWLERAVKETIPRYQAVIAAIARGGPYA